MQTASASLGTNSRTAGYLSATAGETLGLFRNSRPSRGMQSRVVAFDNEHRTTMEFYPPPFIAYLVMIYAFRTAKRSNGVDHAR